jgi:hypothetical protein
VPDTCLIQGTVPLIRRVETLPKVRTCPPVTLFLYISSIHPGCYAPLPYPRPTHSQILAMIGLLPALALALSGVTVQAMKIDFLHFPRRALRESADMEHHIHKRAPTYITIPCLTPTTPTSDAIPILSPTEFLPTISPPRYPVVPPICPSRTALALRTLLAMKSSESSMRRSAGRVSALLHRQTFEATLLAICLVEETTLNGAVLETSSQPIN